MIRPDVTPKDKQLVYWLIVNGRQVVDVKPASPAFAPPLLTVDELPDARRCYTAQIGEYQGHAIYMMIADEHTKIPKRWHWTPLRECLLRSDELLFSLAARACQISAFLSTHRYCGRCGSPVAQSREELAVICGQCKVTDYPRISPCIIVGVYRENEILLANGINHPEGLFSVLAGFVESGESLEQTLVREVYEEVGIEVTDVEYITSQPWPFPHSLMAGFIARYSSGTLTPEPSEIVAADWYALSDLPRIPPSGTIARRLIDAVCARQLEGN